MADFIVASPLMGALYELSISKKSANRNNKRTHGVHL